MRLVTKSCIEKQKENPMFGFGSKARKLEKKYAKLLEEAFQLSTSNRAKSDEKTAEAERVRIQLEALKETD